MDPHGRPAGFLRNPGACRESFQRRRGIREQRTCQEWIRRKLGSDGKTLTWSTYYGSIRPAGRQLAAPQLAPFGRYLGCWHRSIRKPSLDPGCAEQQYARFGYGVSRPDIGRYRDLRLHHQPGTEYSYSAGRQVFSVTAPSGCAWTATPSDGWIHLIRGSGTGSGTIPLTVDANTTANTRNGTVTVNSQIYTIVQPPSSCTYQVTNPSVTSAGGTASITVTAPAGCPWDVGLQTSDPAIVTSPSTGTGNGTVMVSVPPNAGANNISYWCSDWQFLIERSAKRVPVSILPRWGEHYRAADCGCERDSKSIQPCGLHGGRQSMDQPWITENNPPSNAGTTPFRGDVPTRQGRTVLHTWPLGTSSTPSTRSPPSLRTYHPSKTFFDACEPDVQAA